MENCGALWAPKAIRILADMCGRSQGLPSPLPTSEDRVTEPMKADGKGFFTKVSWDDALSDIASHITGVRQQGSAVHDGRNREWYAKRFAWLLSVRRTTMTIPRLPMPISMQRARPLTRARIDTTNAEDRVARPRAAMKRCAWSRPRSSSKFAKMVGYVMPVDRGNARRRMFRR